MENRPLPECCMTIDRLRVEVWADREKTGAAAAYVVAERMQELLTTQEEATMVFAAAPSRRCVHHLDCII